MGFENKIIIKMNLEQTELGMMKEMRKKWMIYSADLGGPHCRPDVIIIPHNHDVNIVKVKDYQGNIVEKIIINIEYNANDFDFERNKKYWLNHYSKQFGGKHLKKHMLIVPRDHEFKMLPFDYFTELNNYELDKKEGDFR